MAARSPRRRRKQSKKSLSDFNDLASAGGSRRRGLRLVKECVETAEAPPPVPPAQMGYTEKRLAERLADSQRGRVLYVKQMQKYYVWDGSRWVEDTGGVEMLARAGQVSRVLATEAAALPARDPQYPELLKAAKGAQSLRSIKAMIELAKAEAEMSTDISRFDSNHYLLNFLNGTLDLQSGRLRPANPEDHITRKLPFAYDPKARTCRRWLKFLQEVLPDAETVGLMQRVLGYVLTGDVSEHVLFFFYGVGANGKSVFLRVLLWLLGEYATTAPTSMLLAKTGDAHPTELTTLFGRRLVVCQETPANRRWAEETLKWVVSEDSISARRMREDFWTFSPTHKLFIAGNNKPLVQGTDNAIWRRLRLVPFERTFSGRRCDRELAEKLHAELPGIMNWAVQGCREWQRNGLGSSKAVNEATESYRTDSDRLGDFLQDACSWRKGSAEFVSRSDLYRSYQSFAGVRGVRPMDERAFAESLRRRGVEEGKRSIEGTSTRCWLGIEIKGPKW